MSVSTCECGVAVYDVTVPAAWPAGRPIRVDTARVPGGTWALDGGFDRVVPVAAGEPGLVEHVCLTLPGTP